MNGTAAPMIVVSIVNWNTAAATLACLASLQALRYTNYRVVVIDNASSDGSADQIRRAHPGLFILHSPCNSGFAGGHELGYRQAQVWGADAIWLLNSDARVEPEALGFLVEAWLSNGDAIYGSVPLRRAGDKVLFNFPAKYLDRGGRPRAFQRDKEIEFTHDWRCRPAFEVGAVAGSSFFLPMQVVRTHGWLDHAWFMYCEEIDYCYRLRGLGVRCFLVPESQIWHSGGASHRSRAQVENCIQYYHSRNEIVLAKRHSGKLVAGLTAAKKVARAALSMTSDTARGRLMLRGVFDALAGRMGKRVAPEDYTELGRRSPINRTMRMHPGHLVKKLLDHFGKFFLRKEELQNGGLAFNPRHTIFIREYYLYCVGLFSRCLDTTGFRMNVVFGDYRANFRRRNRLVEVDIQYEHTLVKPGGRDSAGAVIGKIPIDGSSECYLTRIQNYDYLASLDLVIDYSLPNVVNVRECGKFGAYSDKTVHISPLLYEPDFGRRERSGEIITLFADLEQTRRKAFLEQANESRLPLRNIKGIFDKDELRQLYRNTKILVNIHQTDHHDTLEELRILPALLCGVIIVSEDVPLKEHVPYGRFILWSSYENMIDAVRDAYENYDRHYQRIFCDPELAELLSKMERDNMRNVEAALRALR